MKDREDNISIINKNCKIEGIMHFKGHLIIEGIVEGTIVAETVFTEKDSRVIANINAIFLTIAGFFDGDIEVTDTLKLLKSADVRGQIRCHKLIIDEGGSINGSVKFISQESPHNNPSN
ncbi:MAG TPA: polymer-forming cytoskeletal protein [Syntrophales bacterium]|nr:polymer-forming cytoskeletal protein [Syntrophales bacterium]